MPDGVACILNAVTGSLKNAMKERMRYPPQKPELKIRSSIDCSDIDRSSQRPASTAIVPTGHGWCVEKEAHRRGNLLGRYTTRQQDS